jgi:signal transduction histidine kinase
MTPEPAHGPSALLPLSRTREVIASGRWLLHTRWFVGLGVVVATLAARFVIGDELPTRRLVLTGLTILAYNTVLWLWVSRYRNNGTGWSPRYNVITHIQVWLDWVAIAVLICLTGGIESPITVFFLLHIIIASLLFSRLAALGYAVAAVGVVAAVASLEAAGALHHSHVTDFIPIELAAHGPYVVGTLAVFAILSFVAFYLTSTLADHIRRREVQLATVYEGAQAIISTLELKDVLEGLVRETVEAMGVQGANIGMVDETGTRIVPAATYGLSEAYVNKGPLVLDPGFVQTEVLTTGRPSVIQTDEDRRRLQYPAAVEAEGIRSILFVRLPGKSRPLGLMRAYSSRSNAFGPDDVRFLTTIAAQGAAAIENALAYSSLRQLDADKSKFIKMVTHELRSPVNGALSQLHLLLDGYLGELTTKQLDTLGRLKRRLQTLQALINDLLDLATGRAGLQVVETKPVDLPEALLRVVAQVEAAAAEKRLTVQLHLPKEPESISVTSTAEHVDRILGNIVGNAIKYTPEGGAVVINLRVEAGQAVVQVADTGIGIPATSLPRLFTEFYRANNAKAFETGTGLGLVIVKELVERIGGRIAVESEEGRGTTFTITLPLGAAAA